MEETVELQWYLTFFVGDGSDRESASCYYANIILASSVNNAKKQLLDIQNSEDDHIDNYDAIPCSEMVVKTVV